MVSALCFVGVREWGDAACLFPLFFSVSSSLPFLFMNSGVTLLFELYLF